MPTKGLSKLARHHILLQILKEGGVQTQSELQREMRRRGVGVSQVTVSRDLRELGVAKLAQSGGRRYALDFAGTPRSQEPALRSVLRQFVRSIEAVGQILVIKTPPSGAQPVAVAIDRADLKEVAGTLAGDDTVFVLVRRQVLCRPLAQRLRGLLT